MRVRGHKELPSRLEPPPHLPPHLRGRRRLRSRREAPHCAWSRCRRLRCPGAVAACTCPGSSSVLHVREVHPLRRQPGWPQRPCEGDRQPSAPWKPSLSPGEATPVVKLGVGGFSMGAAAALYSASCFAHGNTLKNNLECSLEAAQRASSLPLLLCHGKADDVVLYKHGERSADFLKSSGFPTLVFESYSRLGNSPSQRRWMASAMARCKLGDDQQHLPLLINRGRQHIVGEGAAGRGSRGPFLLSLQVSRVCGAASESSARVAGANVVDARGRHSLPGGDIFRGSPTLVASPGENPVRTGDGCIDVVTFLQAPLREAPSIFVLFRRLFCRFTPTSSIRGGTSFWIGASRQHFGPMRTPPKRRVADCVTVRCGVGAGLRR